MDARGTPICETEKREFTESNVRKKPRLSGKSVFKAFS